MPWLVYEDPESPGDVIAMWSLNMRCETQLAGLARVYHLSPLGEVVERTSSVLPKRLLGDVNAVDALAAIPDAGGLAPPTSTGGLTPIIEHDGAIFALTEGQLHCFRGVDWRPCDWPEGLIRLKGDVIGVLPDD